MNTYRIRTTALDENQEELKLRNIPARNPEEAARKAADIIAKRLFGEIGRVGALRWDCESRDGRYTDYEAFVGEPSGYSPDGTWGHNVWIYVTDPNL
jgi:hypothetical protein